jgi:hypothetical protein
MLYSDLIIEKSKIIRSVQYFHSFFYFSRNLTNKKMNIFKRSFSLLIIISFSFIISSGFLACNSTEKTEREFNKMAKYFMKKDYRNAVEYFPPAIVEKAGKEKLIIGMERMGSQYFTTDIKDLQIIDQSSNIVSNDTIYRLLMCKQKEIYTINQENVPLQNIHVLYSSIETNPNIIDINWIKHEKQFEAVSSNIFLAVSYDSGEKWYFLVASNKSTLDMLIPNPELRKKIDKEGIELVDKFHK